MKKQPGPVATRAKQGSTHAGIAAALSPFVAFLPPQYQLVGGAVVAALGALAVYLPGND